MTTPNITPDAVMFILFWTIVTGVALSFSSFFARVFAGDVPRNTGSCRKTIYKLIETSPDRDERWWVYSRDMLIFNVICLIILLILFFLQGFLLFNSQNFRAFDLNTAINTSISFVTNTNWQVYSGETAANYLIHMTYLIVQNFLSSVVGVCIAIVVICGITRQFTGRIGNFWAGINRSTSIYAM